MLKFVFSAQNANIPYQNYNKNKSSDISELLSAYCHTAKSQSQKQIHFKQPFSFDVKIWCCGAVFSR